MSPKAKVKTFGYVYHHASTSTLLHALFPLSVSHHDRGDGLGEENKTDLEHEFKVYQSSEVCS